MKRFFTFLIFTAVILSVSAEDSTPKSANEKGYEAQRKYMLMVQENDKEAINRFNSRLDGSSDRGVISDIVNIYRSTFSNNIVSMSSDLIEVGIRAITEVVKSKRPKWEESIKKESEFVKILPAHTEILDFYKAPSTRGPLDPRDILFSGFGCRQYLEYVDETGETRCEEVFYLRCKIDDSELGIARMLNHSKFEMYVDSLSFNPRLCDLPNDSLGVNAATRIGFSFDKRKDLKFRIHATVKSSWINQAMMVFDNIVLGEFDITAEIDPQHLNEKGIFVYSRNADKSSDKKVRITGESFIVPRSYVGTTDVVNVVDTWGTGQYKIDMQVTESCKIKPEYYQNEKGRWVRSKWREEWKLLQKRSNLVAKGVWNDFLKVIGVKYTNGAWVTTLVDPMKTYIIQAEKGALTKANGDIPASNSSQSKKK